MNCQDLYLIPSFFFYVFPFRAGHSERERAHQMKTIWTIGDGNTKEKPFAVWTIWTTVRCQDHLSYCSLNMECSERAAPNERHVCIV